jgi:DNA-binding NarL/FixJ family response regulator
VSDGETAQPVVSAHPGTAPRVRVVLVDDHEGLRTQLASLLTASGLDVVGTAGTVREGLEAVTAFHPDVAVVDNQLPDGRGIDLCQRLRMTVPDVALLLHSGVVTDDDHLLAFEAGVAAVIPKSISARPLLEAIRRYGTP